jgi:hypothetical protein
MHVRIEYVTPRKKIDSDDLLKQRAFAGRLNSKDCNARKLNILIKA